MFEKDAVKKAKDINSNSLQDVLFENNSKIDKKEIGTVFANFFSNKVNSIVNQTMIGNDLMKIWISNQILRPVCVRQHKIVQNS